MTNSLTTGQLIRNLRIQKGMTQEDLAAKTRISARTIQRIENGEVEPRVFTLQTIASALEVDFKEFITRDQNAVEDAHSETDVLWLALLHLSGLFLLLLPPVLIWIWKKDQLENIREHGIDVINFQLSMLAVIIPLAILSFLIITIPIVIFIGIFSSLVIIVNTTRVLFRLPYRYPMSMKILKP
jgi:transcriptional regulator with XRE-family HTH domain